ncbi:MAG: phage tail spike protein [Clostridium sp.]|nr:phage tail spike protein [Clostridium sp.]
MKKQIKVAYFPSDTSKDKVLGSNGKSLDKYCVKCIPDEDLSTGNYIVDLKFLTTDNTQDLLQEEVILKVLLDYGNEIFRISKVTVGTRYIDVVARQITIADSLTLWLEDVRPTNLNGQAAVSWLLDKAEGKKEIQIVSDIDTIATAYYQRMSLYKALHDNDNSFLNRWGGEVQRRGYTIYINKRIGVDRGFTIREGKNLTGFESSSNIDNLVTRARGQGYNGILGNYIDSPLIGSYNRIYTSVIKYDDVKVKDEYNDEGYDTLEEAQAELDRRINEEFSKNDIDKIKASYTINFVQLEKTEEYKDYVVAERLFTGDDSRVYIPKLNVDIKVRAMTKKYDVLAQKTKEIKLSNYIEVKPLSIKQIVEKLETIDSTETILQLAKDNATALIKGGLKNSYVIVRENEIIIGDTKDINTMTNVWRWNSGGLGHSKTGYYGEFGTAITQDGSIVADFITTGVLNAALIKTGILKSFNGRSWINMEDGTFNFADKIKFDGANFDIDLSGKDLATNTSVDTKIEVVNNAISQKVSNSDFNSYKNQTANEISQKVSNGDFGTLFSQTAYGFDFIGKITTKSDNYKLELNANKLIGFKGNDIAKQPMYSAGVWWPNGQPAGYVSVSKGNAETVGTDGALWMTAYPNDNDKAAGIQYMKKHNDGTYVGSIIEFSEAGSISLVSQKTTGAARYGLWSHPDGYIYPYQGDEQLGSNIKPWNKMYCNNLYYKNYSTPFSNSTLAESYQVTALNEEVSRTLVTSEVEKYKDDNSFYTFYKDKFESLVYTDVGNKDRLVVNPNSMLNDPIASILVSKDGDELLLDNNSYITSLTMALKRSIEKIEKLENRIKVLEGGV